MNVDKRFARYLPVYEKTQNSVGFEQFESLLEDFSETERRSLGVASQEIPAPFEQVWTLVEKEAGKLPPGSVRLNKAQGVLKTGLFVSSRFLGYTAQDRFVTKLIATDYGTTIVHTAILRYETSVRATAQPTATVPKRSERWKPSSSLDWDTETQRRLLSRREAFELAVVGLGIFIEELEPHRRIADLPARIDALQDEHRAATTAPCVLELSAELDDAEGLLPNGRIDPGEAGRFIVTIANDGVGTAFGVEIVAQEGLAALELPRHMPVGDLAPGASTERSLQFNAPLELGPGQLQVVLQARERRGFHSDALELTVSAAALEPPKLQLHGVRLDDDRMGDGDGRLGSGETVELELVVENSGRGPAVGVAVVASSASAQVSLPESRLELGRIDPTRSAHARLPVALAPAADDETVEILLSAVDARGDEVARVEHRVSLPVVRRRPLIEISHRLYDGDSPSSRGDRDSGVNNGEAPELELRLANRGTLGAEAIEVTFEELPPGVRIEPNRLVLGDLPPRTEGPPRTLRLALLRNLDHVGPLRLIAAVRQRHFPPVRQALELPFGRRAPSLRVGPRLLAGLVPGRTEERVLLIQNVGDLGAGNVQAMVRSSSPSLVVLDSASAPTPALHVAVGDLQPDAPAFRLPVRLIAKGEGGEDVLSLQVEVAQDDFPPVGESISVPREPPRVVMQELTPFPKTAPPPDPTSVDDRTPPVIWILEPGNEAHQGGVSIGIHSAHVRVRGTASDASGIYRVTVGDEPVTVDANGTFTAWVRLVFGRNDVRITAEDPHGNVGAVHLSVERRGDAGRPRVDRALLFATDRYDHWNALANPVADGRELAATLEATYGFQVELVPNPTKVDVLRTLRRYAEMEPGAEDQLLVFFAGHGHFDDRFDEGYLVTTESLRRDELGTSYLAFSQLANLLDGLPHRHLLVVLDACYGGAFDQRLSRARGPAAEEASRTRAWIADRLRPLSRLYLAAGEIERVDDGPAGGNSPFMRRLLGALHQSSRSDRPLTSRELFVLMDRPAPLDPEPRAGEFGDHEPDGDFLFVPASRR